MKIGGVETLFDETRTGWPGGQPRTRGSALLRLGLAALTKGVSVYTEPIGGLGCRGRPVTVTPYLGASSFDFKVNFILCVL
jgi:hypothetical protein